MIIADSQSMQLKDNTKYWLACIIMILAAFVQCYRTVHDLHWANEPDFDRDIAYIRTTLNGHYGQDANYAGQYMWYNPLLFLTETLIVKLTGLPINIVVARAGAFLNIISPLAFFIMVSKLFDIKTALAALLSFLFLATGNLPCWGAATYSPWLISDSFVQFLFYINVIFCYKAFSTQQIRWFVLLGASIGITFLGHSAPAILIILILISLQLQKIIKAIRQKEYQSIKTYLLQGIVAAIPFLLCASPFLYFVWGKYHFHFVNRAILECAPGIFERKSSVTMLKTNITFSLLIAIIGGIWFYKKQDNKLIRQIIFSWLIITIFMYVYESVVPTLDRLNIIHLPDTIPAFHYFFYLKSLQSIFFAFGFIYLFQILITSIPALSKLKSSNNLFIAAVLLYGMVYFPIYINRTDFKESRAESIAKGNEKDKIEIYNFIEKNIPLNNVLLCEHDLSLFPVMPTAIKMVSVETYFSNPYLSYDQRESDRNTMLNYLGSGSPASAVELFNAYKVRIVLLTNRDYAKLKTPAFASNKVLFKNGSYTLMSFGINKKNLPGEL
ncbi:hypothetical protein [Mucilaginibacter xinganensis]|uniref:Glycosyltransferase RgtA/B/C/D-like domain-containing protein n=1 Tax=Mucilaginibacter xinganensis TaxID=1234841 RepID=A0A223NZX1_9SPHI|nr:hypothetical protein [Mucilaginibacter xinganensis]ASU35118.1 hypothetical protein MuYL_3233 [Mucilaginibacter xinganensis]